MEMKRMSSSAWSVGDKKPRRSVMGGDFVRKVAEEEDASWVGRLRAKATQATSSVYMANFMVTVVFADAYCTCRDIDARADGLSGPPRVFSVLSDLCLVLYTAELLMYIFINGIRILRDWMICMDVVIITCGYIELVFNWAGESEGVVGISIVRALRLVRIFRLIRLLRKIRTLRELHKLAMMMATCAKTLVWSFLLCFLVMTLWSMLMVETVHPLLQ
ncbi:Potassium voltage-gated channel protein eag, partial [Durusdinium trenchii]